MLNLETLENNDGMTLVDGKEVSYKTGYQVATEGVECKTIRDAINAIKHFGGNCGVWYSGGIYYIDKCHRVKTLKQAIRIGRACHQQSILKWADMSLIWLKRTR